MTKMNKEEFKLAFFGKCAERGYTFEDMQRHVYLGLEKAAKNEEGTLDTLKRMALAPAKSLPYSLAAGLGLGGALGFGTSRMTDISKQDIRNARVAEILNLYRQRTKQMEEENNQQSQPFASKMAMRKILKTLKDSSSQHVIPKTAENVARGSTR